MKFEGKVVVATAAGNGIGRAIVREFAAGGASVIVSDYDLDAAEAVAHEIVEAGGRGVAQRCNVALDADVAALADRAFGDYGRVDVLMNHAGLGAAGPVDQIPLDDWRAVFDVNILGQVRGVNAFLPRMAAQRDGLIVNTSSSLALFPEMPVALPYITTKAASIGFSQGLFLYCKPLGIRVMALVPDITKTNFHYSARITNVTEAQAMSMLPLNDEQPPEAVRDAFFAAVAEGRFMACNVPDVEQHLIASAQDGLQPAYRAYPSLEQPIGAFVRSTM
jgi:NAD(P)-dependent dehydrogenase (short-subunit alcohol dehydrogenase family)